MGNRSLTEGTSGGQSDKFWTTGRHSVFGPNLRWVTVIIPKDKYKIEKLYSENLESKICDENIECSNVQLTRVSLGGIKILELRIQMLEH